ncbi:MOSC domain-containing protein [Kocuria sp. ZOR0020]|uniref:MOSC domain-containing protein n=1 Tax=Kocuria sp. ZOR0020 TaxID=1339234 RepID=UPI0006456D24|nr:MOSC domain-containing protein [Kocuria sp. ZOR0020]
MSSGTVMSVNTGSRQQNPAPNSLDTGIHKGPVDHAVEIRDPGMRGDGPGSGVIGDYIGDDRHHGGEHQAVYAFAREELDHWESELGLTIPPGTFGENLTIGDYDVDSALLGEIWRIGEVRLQVTGARTPCRTFAAVMQQQGWVKTFTQRARTGAYLRVLEAGEVKAGMDLTVEFRPDHGITVSQSFRAATTQQSLLPEMVAAEPYLHPELRRRVEQALARP